MDTAQLTRRSDPATNAETCLRPATAADARLLFTWRNDPWIVEHGTSQRLVSWDEHAQWFADALEDERRLMFIIEENHIPAGMVRLERMANDAAQAAIYLMRQFTGRGLGPRALESACRRGFASWSEIDSIRAHIRCDNRPSLRAFARTGFRMCCADHSCPADHVHLERQRDSTFQKTKLTVPHNRLTFTEAEEAAATAVIRSGHWARGPRTRDLESRLADTAGVRHAVCVSSGCAALRLALRSVGVSGGDAVLVPAYACSALANSVLACGGEPLAVDVAEDNWCIAVRETKEAAKRANAKAIVAVHTFGAPAPIAELRDLQIPIIEDCSHALALSHRGQMLGGIGDLAVISFFATKLIAAGQGGAVLTNSAERADFIREQRGYADKAPSALRMNDEMTDIEAALALCQLQRLPDMLRQRRSLASRYRELLGAIAKRTGWFSLPKSTEPHAWYRYVVKLKDLEAATIVQLMKRSGITAQLPVTDWRVVEKSNCPSSAQAYQRLVSLPLYPTLTHAEQDAVVAAFLNACVQG